MYFCIGVEKNHNRIAFFIFSWLLLGSVKCMINTLTVPNSCMKSLFSNFSTSEIHHNYLFATWGLTTECAWKYCSFYNIVYFNFRLYEVISPFATQKLCSFNYSSNIPPEEKIYQSLEFSRTLNFFRHIVSSVLPFLLKLERQWKRKKLKV